MYDQEGGQEKSVVRHGGDMFFADVNCVHSDHPCGEVRILIFEKEDRD